MPFFSGNTDADTLLNKMANELIATGAWLDADPFYPNGGTTRVITHATDANFYVTFTRRVVTSPVSGRFRWNEIAVIVSSGYNLGTHAATGTIYTTGIPLEGWQNYSGSYGFFWGTTTGSGNKTGQYWMWVDAAGLTVVSTWTPGPGYDYTVFLNLERNTAKEYADGFTNFFLTVLTNDDRELNLYDGIQRYAQYFDSSFSTGNPTWEDLNRPEYLRPFNVVDVTWGNGGTVFFNAYKSPGNSKVYFQFPLYSNNLDPSRRAPIATTDKWFWCGISVGLADGDLINYVSGPDTFTFLVKLLQSPDSTAYLPVAIREA